MTNNRTKLEAINDQIQAETIAMREAQRTGRAVAVASHKANLAKLNAERKAAMANQFEDTPQIAHIAHEEEVEIFETLVQELQQMVASLKYSPLPRSKALATWEQVANLAHINATLSNLIDGE